MFGASPFLVLTLVGGTTAKLRLRAGTDRWQWGTDSTVAGSVSLGIEGPGLTVDPSVMPLQTLGGAGLGLSPVNANPGADTFLLFSGPDGAHVFLFVSGPDYEG